MAVILPLNRDHKPLYGAVETLGPGLRRVTANNPGPFTFTGTGTYIVGEGRVAVIDPGPDDPAHVAAILEAVRGETVSHILVTHTHIDHSPATPALKGATGATVYAQGPHAAHLRDGADGGMDAGGDMDFEPDEVLVDGSVVEGDGWRLEALHTPGHCSNHLCFAWDERRGLFSGDQVMGWSTTIVSPPDGDMGDYLRGLDRLLGRSDEIYWPTHGAAIPDPKALVTALIAHRREREQAILDQVAAGHHRVDDMVREIYRDVPAHLHPAAARSTLAAIVHLVETGRLAVDGGAVTLEARYGLPG